MLCLLFFLIYFANIFSFISMETNEIDDDDGIDLSHFGAKIYGQPKKHDGSVERYGNPEEQGDYLEGDLLIPTSAKNGIRDQSYRWKHGEVPFVINGNFDAFMMDKLERAFNEYKAKTCIKFIPRRPSDRDYISIENAPTGCWSSIGRIGGKQIVNLQTPLCLSLIGTVLHELLHVVGFFHEQNREDRDSYVTINSKNIRDGYQVNFAKIKKGDSTSFGVGYDYGSVLHYSADAFSKNGKPTIVAKKKTNEAMGQRKGFSQKDIEKINKMYKCQRSADDSFFGNVQRQILSFNNENE
ncbi:CLUMA_CG010702, isoform A [Clunio marinus]|uniref:Metalloendopeptidase n=1 Tax=Clunio marinus TaxID=568069 RepID=A0A1J1IAR9_9DIPT|nr:CLUMA_CG010702, isoform A [Clunio marinus]